MDQQVLSMCEELEERWEDPEDEVWPYEQYVLKKGDPATNGLGHMVTHNPKGQKVVLVPTLVGRRVNSYSRKAQLKSQLDDGSAQLSGDHMTAKFREVGDYVTGPASTGKSFDKFADMFAKFELALGGSSSSSGGAGGVLPKVSLTRYFTPLLVLNL